MLWGVGCLSIVVKYFQIQDQIACWPKLHVLMCIGAVMSGAGTPICFKKYAYFFSGEEVTYIKKQAI